MTSVCLSLSTLVVKLFTGGIVTSAGLATVNGQMTGSGAWMSPADKQRAIQGGWRPYTIFGQSYENAPDWMRLSMSLMSDIVMAHVGMDSKAHDDWLGAMSDVLAANVNNELFGTEVE